MGGKKALRVCEWVFFFDVPSPTGHIYCSNATKHEHSVFRYFFGFLKVKIFTPFSAKTKNCKNLILKKAYS